MLKTIDPKKNLW